MKDSLVSKKFSHVYNNSIIIKTPQILYKILPSKLEGRFAFIINKKAGSASARNLFRRRARSLYRQLVVKKHNKIDMIIIPKTINLTWIDIKNSFELMLKNTHG